MDIAEYLGAERGRSAKVALLTGMTAAFVSQIATRARQCPAERGAALERACDFAVRRWDLRPLDWHRIWPELIGTEGAPSVPSAQPIAQEAV